MLSCTSYSAPTKKSSNYFCHACKREQDLKSTNLMEAKDNNSAQLTLRSCALWTEHSTKWWWSWIHPTNFVSVIDVNEARSQLPSYGGERPQHLTSDLWLSALWKGLSSNCTRIHPTNFVSVIGVNEARSQLSSSRRKTTVLNQRPLTICIMKGAFIDLYLNSSN